ncbi:EamA family transporter [Propionibacteriaceae bacterium Y1700]|uniref:EamA family transporter n=1 Tax=Microlunatus sp. Y1700 TaxID=3418487 RepID=UPI003DA7293B
MPAELARRIGPAGLLVALLSAASFGVSGPFAKALMEIGWTPGSTALARIGGSALVLALPTVLLMRGRWQVLRRRPGTVIAYGLFGVAGTQVFYFNALAHLPVGVALLLEYTSPLMVVLYLWARHRRVPGWLTLIGGVLTMVGLVVVLDLTGSLAFSVTGVLLALGAAVCNSVYFVMAADTSNELSPMAMTGLGMVVATVAVTGAIAIGLMPSGVALGDTAIAGVPVPWWLPVLGMVGISTVVAYVTGVFSARRLGSQVASFVAITEVVFAALVAWWWAGERLTTIQGVGALLIMIGIIVVKLDDARAAIPRSVRERGAVDVGTGVGPPL